MKSINRPLLTMVSIAALLAGCDSLTTKKPDAENHVTSSQAHSSHSSSSIASIPQGYEDIWGRIRAGYGLPNISNARIDTQLQVYEKNRAYFSQLTQQAEPYMYHVVTEMQANGIPLELALLPFIESSYNPSASAYGNAGMWQLASATGKSFGLKHNSWYDGRKDVVASTDAAIHLLKRLHDMFDNDWLLAIAAYNAGEGTVQIAIDKNRRAGKPTDFWSLRLNSVTQNYVPQLLALAKVIADPERYDFKLYPIPDTPYFVKINVGSQINLAQAAQESNLDVQELKKLNAGFTGWLTDPTGPYSLLVPVSDAAEFTLRLENLPKIPSVKWQEHQVKKGDTLDSIAKKYGVNSASIKTVNNLKTNMLSVGQHLQIPLSPITNNIASTQTTATTHSAPANSNNSNYYTVKNGESLWSIAKTQKTSIDSLAQLNDMDPETTLYPGQKLLVLSQADSAETQPHKITYTIKAGDTLGKIANLNHLSVKQIMQWNSIKNETSLRPNQVLVIWQAASN